MNFNIVLFLRNKKIKKYNKFEPIFIILFYTINRNELKLSNNFP